MENLSTLGSSGQFGPNAVSLCFHLIFESSSYLDLSCLNGLTHDDAREDWVLLLNYAEFSCRSHIEEGILLCVVQKRNLILCIPYYTFSSTCLHK